MKTGFKDPIAVKPEKNQRSPWNFDAPQYDQRSSCFISAGSDYGVGHRQPVGHEGNPKTTADVLPKGRVDTLILYPNAARTDIIDDEKA